MTESDTIKSDETLLGIINVLYNRGRTTVTEVTDAVDVSKSTVHRHLATLQKHNYVTKEGTEYALGFRFLDLGGHVRHRDPIYKQVKSLVRNIAEETGEFVGFLVEEHGLGTYIYSEWGSEGVGNDVRIGRRIHLHQSAAGKAILAHLPEERTAAIIDKHGLPKRTPETITSRDELERNLETIRERGYAYAHSEHTEGLWAVGVPVHDVDGGIAGGLLVAAPTYRMRGEQLEDELPEYLLGAAKEFELNMSHL
ncbi:IclR family transcriptional regulator [Halostagnicola sp. A-GB9-2]|uniref:IclR family transcriptional regulator n=1 Tax=Halostagnicola sp. A-GB9-2 TaxID=3048066 RepID=UPI0024C0074D|nr:IclR family transcriptional regulator [Halostagnicola sp. A-GB9-2]MDJ1433791.1 IclR family transcriptional regulator [Halostagnicola sp. A-GB9-2]